VSNGVTVTNPLTVAISEPFDKNEGPKDLPVGTDFAKAAFALTPEEPFPAKALEGRDGIYIIAYYKRIPSHILPFEEIKDRVTEDYKYNEAVIQARTAGRQFYQTLTNGLAQGKTFEAVCEEAKVKPFTVPPFSISTRELPAIEDYISLSGRGGLKELAFSTPVGKVSPFYPTHQGGVVLEVKSRLPIDEAKEKAELPDFMTYVRQSRQTEAFDIWFRTEVDRGIPWLFRQQQQQQAQPGGTAKS